MGGKHLKKLRAEKSKVHLKKKKLPKGQNVTNTAFTVKKILTVEQLQKVEKDEPVSNWNVPLKDLLIRLTHYNFTSRLNSLCGIKEILSKYPEILRGPLLKPLISRLLELLSDEEHKIRITAVELLSSVFDLISPSSIIVFQKLLNLHLECAMTHRNTSVQQDSLKLIDVMVKQSPEAIKCNFKGIAQNFIRIMKRYFYESHAGVFSSGKSKQDLEKTKREMLLRFYQFLVTGYPRVMEKNQSEYMNNNIDVCITQRITLRDSDNQYKKIPDLSIFKSSESKENLIHEMTTSEFTSLCSLVIPLLFDTWTEFFPQERFNETSECVLTASIGEMLSVVLKILLFFYERAVALQDTEVEHWFISKYGPAFKKSFTFGFPYLPVISPELSKHTDFCDLPKGFNFYTLQNLIICYLAYSLKTVDKKSKLESKIESYVSGVLKMNQKEVEILLKVVQAEIDASGKKSNIILSKAVAAYGTTGNPEFRQKLSKVLMNIALEENGYLCQKDQSIMSWMKSLPDRLCHSHIFVEEVETILKLINTSTGTEVLREIEFRAQEILGNLQNIKVEGINRLEGQKMIADILYRCNTKVLIGIMNADVLDKKIYHQDLRNYISDIFSQRLTNRLESCEA